MQILIVIAFDSNWFLHDPFLWIKSILLRAYLFFKINIPSSYFIDKKPNRKCLLGWGVNYSPFFIVFNKNLEKSFCLKWNLAHLSNGWFAPRENVKKDEKMLISFRRTKKQERRRRMNSVYLLCIIMQLTFLYKDRRWSNLLVHSYVILQMLTDAFCCLVQNDIMKNLIGLLKNIFVILSFDTSINCDMFLITNQIFNEVISPM